MANVAKLFHTTVDPETYLANLTPDDALLRAARSDIRAHLRSTFEKASLDVFGRTIRPRFFTQGSFAYKTLNGPAWPPAQQMDLDDGCYLPLSFVRGAKPSQAARKFFQFIDGALKQLAAQRGWKFVEKDTCSRVVISSTAHVDVPLYAIPDKEFTQLQDRAITSMKADRAKVDSWGELPSDAVLLAHRVDDWVESDPRKIHNWFTDAVDLYGERLRRDARFLKGWRDFKELDRYRVTSILLMACVWQAYEEIRGPFLPDREDERILRVLEKVPKYIGGAVPNPACRTEDLNRIPTGDRDKVIKELQALIENVSQAVRHCDDPHRAIDLLRDGFGQRVPRRPDLVSVAAAAVTKAAAEPKRVVPAPEVGRSRSG
jgi:hypothetical protein